jgi:DNA polymerase III subunit delta'
MSAATPETLAPSEGHAHVRAVLGSALTGGAPSHAYLFHGPAGSGKAAVAREFAATLLIDGAASPDTVRDRVERDCHPDLTWVRPSGAAEMLVSDIEQPVVAAATRTPFESRRRVFVIESAETMNDQSANRLLKTLEEPPPFVHLLLLTERREDVLPTIASRCQQVRFDPAPPARVAASLTGVQEPEALSCARLALGDGDLAARFASERGRTLRAGAERYVRGAIAGRTQDRPWLELLEAARAAGGAAGEAVQERLAAEAELLPSKERKRHEREGMDARRRAERRARTRTLQDALQIAELWLRDLLCVKSGASELVHALDRASELEQDAELLSVAALERGIDLVAATRLSLDLNVSEELALEALAYRLQEIGA